MKIDKTLLSKLIRTKKPAQLVKQDLSKFELDHKSQILKVSVPPQSAFQCNHRSFVGGNGGVLTASSFYTEDQPAECLLAPRKEGELAIVNIADQSMTISNSCFLAATQNITIKKYLQNSIVTGVGKLVIAGSGSVSEVNLKDGEEYLVSKQHLLAWNGTVSLVENFQVKQDVVLPTASLGTFAQYWLLNKGRYYQAWVSYQIRARLYGEDALYRISGPSKFWLSSRRQ